MPAMRGLWHFHRGHGLPLLGALPHNAKPSYVGTVDLAAK